MMRVLVIGSGGREHALAWKLRESNQVTALYCAPGNGGTTFEAENIPLADNDLPGLVAFAKEHSINLVVPGPELPLTLGIVDAMKEAGIPAFGPDKWCAQLEGSKSFAKEIMHKAGVPTADSFLCHDVATATEYVKKHGAPLVIKADGLAAGKGVFVAKTEAEALAAIKQIMKDRAFGSAGDTVVIEEFLQGEEVSLLAFCSGETALPLPSAQDHKAAFDGDTGPNTGGMGAYSPAPILPDCDLEKITDLTIRPILRELVKEGHPYTGILYAGLMMTAQGPKVLEYNVRFGDPECQPILMRLENDLPELMLATVQGKLAEKTIQVSAESALGVVLTADGYPASYPKGMPITGIANAERMLGVKVFQAGTKVEGKQVISSGGRVLCVTALGTTLAEAQKQAYKALECVHMPQSRYRHDIGAKGLRRIQELSK